MTQQQLVDRLGELGLKMDRSTLNKLERGHHAATAPLDKVFTIAAALEIPPLHLILPLEDDQPVAVTPSIVVDARLARAWVRGLTTLPGRSMTLAELPPSELEHLVWRARTRGMDAVAAALMAEELSEDVRRIVDEIRNPKEENDG